MLTPSSQPGSNLAADSLSRAMSILQLGKRAYDSIPQSLQRHLWQVMRNYPRNSAYWTDGPLLHNNSAFVIVKAKNKKQDDGDTIHQ